MDRDRQPLYAPWLVPMGWLRRYSRFPTFLVHLVSLELPQTRPPFSPFTLGALLVLALEVEDTIGMRKTGKRRTCSYRVGRQPVVSLLNYLGHVPSASPLLQRGGRQLLSRSQSRPPSWTAATSLCLFARSRACRPWYFLASRPDDAVSASFELSFGPMPPHVEATPGATWRSAVVLYS